MGFIPHMTPCILPADRPHAEVRLLKHKHIYIHQITYFGPRDSAISIETRYELDGLRFETRCQRDFPCRPDQLRDPPNLLYNGYRISFSGEKGRGLALTTLPHTASRLNKGWSYTSTSLPCLYPYIMG